MFGMTSDNSSNLSTAADIDLGPFRYCVNAQSGKGKVDVARNIFSNLSRIFWYGVEEKGKVTVKGYGYHPQPQVESVRNPVFQQRYDDLSDSLTQFSMQPIETK